VETDLSEFNEKKKVRRERRKEKTKKERKEERNRALRRFCVLI